MAIITWRKKLDNLGLDTKDILKTVPEIVKWDEEFDGGYGGPEGQPFIAWTKGKVIFCQCYDGAEWLEAVPRNPELNLEPEHLGRY